MCNTEIVVVIVSNMYKPLTVKIYMSESICTIEINYIVKIIPHIQIYYILACYKIEIVNRL